MRRIAVALAAVLVVLLPGTPAQAHAQLVSSDPAGQSTLAAAPTSVTLTFNERLNPDFTTIVVSDAAKQRIATSAPAVDRAQGTVTLTGALGNGAYTVAYRVVSVDGHTVQGSYPFTLNDPALPPAAAPSAAAAAPVADSGVIPTGVLIGLGAAGIVLAALAAFFFLKGRRRGA